MARPTNTETQNEQMRQRLIQGALELFRAGGVDAVSLRKLADHVGVSHTTLYRYYSNKSALLNAIRVGSLLTLRQYARDADDPTMPVLERIRAAALALIRYGTQHPREYRFVFAEEQPALRQQEKLVAVRHEIFDHIVELATEAEKKGLIAMDARTWVHIAWSTLHGMMILQESKQLLEGRQFEELLTPALDTLLPDVSSQPRAVGRR